MPRFKAAANQRHRAPSNAASDRPEPSAKFRTNLAEADHGLSLPGAAWSEPKAANLYAVEGQAKATLGFARFRTTKVTLTSCLLSDRLQ